MLKSVKEEIGEINCLGIDCNHTVPLRKDSLTGSLSFSCQWCGFPGYAKNDGRKYYKSVLAMAGSTPPTPADPALVLVEKKRNILFG